jgi:phage replication-related protein YjqB (UPF0714/DUF867 family)
LDKYTNIAELKQNEREDEDYTILYRELPSKIAIMAPHGGGIKPGTIDIADNLAGCDYTFYAFIGVSSISGHFAFVDWSDFSLLPAKPSTRLITSVKIFTALSAA